MLHHVFAVTCPGRIIQRPRKQERIELPLNPYIREGSTTIYTLDATPAKRHPTSFATDGRNEGWRFRPATRQAIAGPALLLTSVRRIRIDEPKEVLEGNDATWQSKKPDAFL